MQTMKRERNIIGYGGQSDVKNILTESGARYVGVLKILRYITETHWKKNRMLYGHGEKIACLRN